MSISGSVFVSVEDKPGKSWTAGLMIQAATSLTRAGPASFHTYNGFCGVAANEAVKKGLFRRNLRVQLVDWSLAGFS